VSTPPYTPVLDLTSPCVNQRQDLEYRPVPESGIGCFKLSDVKNRRRREQLFRSFTGKGLLYANNSHMPDNEVIIGGRLAMYAPESEMMVPSGYRALRFRRDYSGVQPPLITDGSGSLNKDKTERERVKKRYPNPRHSTILRGNIYNLLRNNRGNCNFYFITLTFPELDQSSGKVMNHGEYEADMYCYRVFQKFMNTLRTNHGLKQYVCVCERQLGDRRVSDLGSHRNALHFHLVAAFDRKVYDRSLFKYLNFVYLTQLKHAGFQYLSVRGNFPCYKDTRDKALSYFNQRKYHDLILEKLDSEEVNGLRRNYFLQPCDITQVRDLNTDITRIVRYFTKYLYSKEEQELNYVYCRRVNSSIYLYVRREVLECFFALSMGFDLYPKLTVDKENPLIARLSWTPPPEFYERLNYFCDNRDSYYYRMDWNMDKSAFDFNTIIPVCKAEERCRLGQR
jgi:hypothetical protein